MTRIQEFRNLDQRTNSDYVLVHKSFIQASDWLLQALLETGVSWDHPAAVRYRLRRAELLEEDE